MLSGVLPLATLGRLPIGVELVAGLAAVIRQLAERVRREAPPEKVGRLLTAAFVLTGLRVSPELSRQLFQGVGAMHESSTYQFILDEGEARGLRKVILNLGTKRFGAADEASKAILLATDDLARLEYLTQRLLEVHSWRELLESS